MKKNYYIVQQGKQRGPLSFEDLTQLQYKSGTQLWTPGLPDWVSVVSMEEVVVKVSSTYQGEPMPGAAGYSTSGSGSGFTSTGNTKMFGEMLRNTGGAVVIEHELASLGLRFGGMFVTAFITFGLFTLAGDHKLLQTLTMFIIPLSSLITYQFWSGNIGHFLLGMKVVHAKDGSDFNNPVLGAIREFIKGLIGWFVIPAIWLLWDKDRQNLYDKIFSTKVVMRSKNK